MKNILTLSIHSRISGFLVLFLMIFLSPSVHAQLFDTQFNPGDWSMLILNNWSSPLAQCGHPAPHPPCQCGKALLIGNPAPSRQTCTFYPVWQPGMPPPPPPPYPWSIWIVHLYTPPSSFYDPSTQGAIAGVRFSYDLSPPSKSMTYGLLLFQDGKYYRSRPADTPADTATAPTWKIFPPRTLTAADFLEVRNGADLGIRPNFSCTGKPIQFGYVTGTSSGNHVSQSLIDNWKVDVIKGECLCLTRISETIACGQPAGSYSYSVQLQNQIGTTIPQIQVVPTLPTGVTLSQQMFTVALAPNGTTTLNFTINGASPGATVSLRFLPIGVGTSQCCPPEIKVTMPKQGQC